MATARTESDDAAAAPPPARLALASLAPDAVAASRAAFFQGVVTLLWPYSPSSATLSLLVCEEDVQLRVVRGQVRVDFHGPAAREAARAQVDIGSVVHVSLAGAVLGALPDASPRDVPWTVAFASRLDMKVRARRVRQARTDAVQVSAGAEWLDVAVDEPAAAAATAAADPGAAPGPAAAPAERTPSPSPSPVTPRSRSPPSPSTPPASYIFSQNNGHAWTTPNLFKRTADFFEPASPFKLQGLFDEPDDDDNDDDDNDNDSLDAGHPNKRQKFSSSFRLVDRTPSPGPEDKPDHDMEQGAEGGQPSAGDDDVPQDEVVTHDENTAQDMAGDNDVSQDGMEMHDENRSVDQDMARDDDASQDEVKMHDENMTSPESVAQDIAGNDDAPQDEVEIHDENTASLESEGVERHDEDMASSESVAQDIVGNNDVPQDGVERHDENTASLESVARDTAGDEAAGDEAAEDETAGNETAEQESSPSQRPTKIGMPPPPIPSIFMQSEDGDENRTVPESPSLRPVSSPSLPLVSPFLHQGLPAGDYMEANAKPQSPSTTDATTIEDEEDKDAIQSFFDMMTGSGESTIPDEPTTGFTFESDTETASPPADPAEPAEQAKSHLAAPKSIPSPGRRDDERQLSDYESEKDSLFDEMSDAEPLPRKRIRSKSPMPGPSPLRKELDQPPRATSPTPRPKRLKLKSSSPMPEDVMRTPVLPHETPFLYLPTPSPKIVTGTTQFSFSAPPLCAPEQLPEMGDDGHSLENDTMRTPKRKLFGERRESAPSNLSAYFGRPTARRGSKGDSHHHKKPSHDFLYTDSLLPPPRKKRDSDDRPKLSDSDDIVLENGYRIPPATLQRFNSGTTTNVGSTRPACLSSVTSLAHRPLVV